MDIGFHRNTAIAVCIGVAAGAIIGTIGTGFVRRYAFTVPKNKED